MRKLYICAAVSAVLASVSCSQKEATTFCNPVIQCDLADPSVMRVGEKYYATGSSYNWAPEYPLYVSDDLVNWKQIGNVLEEKPEWTGTGFWAPELFEHNGKFYCFYSGGRASDGRHCIGAAVADSPEGPYKDLGCILDSGTEQIDSYIFKDDGKLYMSWKAHGVDRCPDEIACRRLSDDCLRFEGDEFTVVRDDEGLGMEGQCMFKREGWYYLLYSARSCCGPMSDYEVRLARAVNVEGPWEKCPDNPILSGGTGEVKAIGHGSVVETPDGRLFYLCHAYFSGERFFLGRRPFLSELECTDDGWIRCVTGSSAAVRQNSPFRGTVQKISDEFTEDFTKGELDPSWSHPIADGECSVLCQRPFCTDYTVEAEVNRSSEDSVKGLVFFGSYADYAAIVVEKDAIVVRTAFDGTEEVIRTWPLSDAPMTLSATVRGALNATFEWTAGDKGDVCALPAGLERLMRWDSAFRPGICSSGRNAEDSFLSFKMKAIR